MQQFACVSFGRADSRLHPFARLHSRRSRLSARQCRLEFRQPHGRARYHRRSTFSFSIKYGKTRIKVADVTELICEHIASVYQENSPQRIYFLILYNIFSEFLEDISEDVLPNDRTGYQDSAIWKKLYNFQKDAATASSTSSRPTTAASSPTASASGRRSPRWRSSNTTSSATDPCSFSARRNSLTTG